MPLILLFALMLLLMAMRVYAPVGTAIRGSVSRVVNLNFQERVLLQRINMYSLGVVLLLMSVTGFLPTIAEVLVVLIALSIVAVPVRYILTVQGVGLNNVLYRPWSEFDSFSVSPRMLVLHGKDGVRDLQLHLLTSHQREAVPIIRRHLAEAKSSQHAPSHRRAPAR